MTTKLTIGFVRRGYSRSGGAEAYLKLLARGVVGAGHRVQLITTNDWPPNEWPFGAITHLRARSPIEFADELEQIRSQLRCDLLMSLERLWRCDIYRAGDGVHRAWLIAGENLKSRFNDLFEALIASIATFCSSQKLCLQAAAQAASLSTAHGENEVVNLYHYPAAKIDIVRNGARSRNSGFDPVAGRIACRFECETGHCASFRLSQAGSARFAVCNCSNGVVPQSKNALVRRGSRKPTPLQIQASTFWRSWSARYWLVEPRGLARLLRSVPAGRFRCRSYRHSCRCRHFILPTIYDPFSNVCLEALVRLAVITTRDNGFAEIIEEGVHDRLSIPPTTLHVCATPSDSGLRSAGVRTQDRKLSSARRSSIFQKYRDT
jgi:UDP-glucose:(heptosyl)LPS alpha-1,3-glucosyltransferase